MMMSRGRTPADETGCLPELGEGELSSPHLTLAAETVSADELEPRKDRNERVSSCFAKRRAKRGILFFPTVTQILTR